MAITRTVWTDDDGSGTTGTIVNNAEKVTLYDQIDAVVDAVKAGGIGLASQAALDFLFASSATQLGRLAAPAALQSVRMNAGATAYEAYTPTSVLIKGYAATLANVENTGVETTVLSFTVPGGDWADGDLIDIWWDALAKNNKGTAGTAVTKLNVGAGAQVTLASTATDSWSDSATEFIQMGPIAQLIRRGATVDVVGGSTAWTVDNTRGGLLRAATSGQISPQGQSAPANFTADQVVSIKTTLSAAHATFYLKPQSARVYKIAAT